MATTVSNRSPNRRLSNGALRRARRERLGPLAAMSHIALVVWTVLVIVPILWVFTSSVKSQSEIFGGAWLMPERLRLENFADAWNKAQIGTYMLNSVIVVSFGVLLTMIVGSMGAYVLARYEFLGSRALYMFFVAGLAFPIYLALSPLYFVVKNMSLLPVLGTNGVGSETPIIGGILGFNTYFTLILVYAAFSMPFTVFFLAAFFRTLPTAIAEAAYIDGASHTRVFFRIMLPMAKPGLISITIFNVLGQWNQYLLPLVLNSADRSKWVLTQGIATISITAGYKTDWPAMFAALTMAIIPMIIVYIIFQRQIQSGLTAGALK